MARAALAADRFSADQLTLRVSQSFDTSLFDLAAYDAEGKLVTSLGQSIHPTLTPAQQQQLIHGPFRFFQQLDLPPGQFFLRIGILDATSSKIGTLEIPVTVPEK